MFVAGEKNQQSGRSALSQRLARSHSMCHGCRVRTSLGRQNGARVRQNASLMEHSVAHVQHNATSRERSASVGEPNADTAEHNAAPVEHDVAAGSGHFY